MNYIIKWTPEALATFDDRIAYLKIHWTEKEITNFKKRVKEYLEVLKEKPLIGKKPGKFKMYILVLLLNKCLLSIV